MTFAGDSAVPDAMKPYALGQTAFERGQYREAVEHFQEALSLTSETSAMGGKIQIWLVTAYDAAGRTEEAVTLCRQLRAHGNYETRQQSKQLLYILEAPKLQLKAEWLTQIPEIRDGDSDPPIRQRASGRTGSSASVQAQAGIEPMEPIDPKESRGFLAVGLSLTLGLLAFWWLSHSDIF